MGTLIGAMVSSPVREQIMIVTDNIHTLESFNAEMEPGPVRQRISQEMASQVTTLSELRERAYRGVVLGEGALPLEQHPTRIEVLDLLKQH